MNSIGHRSCKIIMEEKTTLSHKVVCFQMLDFGTSQSNSEVSKSDSWKITSFSLLQCFILSTALHCLLPSKFIWDPYKLFDYTEDSCRVTKPIKIVPFNWSKVKIMFFIYVIVLKIARKTTKAKYKKAWTETSAKQAQKVHITSKTLTLTYKLS